jgi:hypothetical protein
MALSTWLARDSAAMCLQGTVRIFPDASHWLQHDKPQEVTQAILDFLDDTDRQDVASSYRPPLVADVRKNPVAIPTGAIPERV